MEYRPSMQEIWIRTAIDLSLRSKCSKAKVGCVITTKDLRHVLGNGYNGYAAGIEYTCTEENCHCLHAENNAVIDAGSSVKDKVFFVTMFPCLSCTIQIINSGCSKLYYDKTYKEGSRHWKDYDLINKMFSDSKIEIIKI